MGRHLELPYHFYINVDNKFLGSDMPEGTTEGIWWGCFSRLGQTLLCHVMLESGAHWSGIPLHSISTSHSFSRGHSELMPWATMGEDIESIHSKYLEGLSCKIFNPFSEDGRHTGIIIDWKDGYSRYPQEHKPLNLVNLNSGQFCLIPNNYLTFEDSHFVDDKAKTNLKNYKRNSKIFWGS